MSKLKNIGDSKKAEPKAGSTIEISFDDVTAWMAGEAKEEKRLAIAADLRRPDSQVRAHLDWVADPNKHQPGAAKPPTFPLHLPRAEGARGPERFIGTNDPTGQARTR
jgi:hypothetical protein